jgi:hypothetical protein
MAALVLLGAGASYGSESDKTNCPPLGNALFDELEKRGGVAATLPDELKLIFRQHGFEKGMAAFFERNQERVAQFQRELGNYLATFEPSPRSLYTSLLKSVPDRRVIYSSLNYDLLLETAAWRLDRHTSYDIITTDKDTRLLKLHASCNFWPHEPGLTIKKITAKRTVGAVVDIGVKVLGRNDALEKYKNPDAYAPVMAVYAEGKQVQYCPSFVRQQ